MQTPDLTATLEALRAGRTSAAASAGPKMRAGPLWWCWVDMERTPEPELMDGVEQAQAYAAADFSA